ncbi:MAG: hypothetical protein KGL39_21370 [Patescibacteria group bacterium]|nr:hypothetical protein [Patescibacteria group bacterium]
MKFANGRQVKVAPVLVLAKDVAGNFVAGTLASARELPTGPSGPEEAARLRLVGVPLQVDASLALTAEDAFNLAMAVPKLDQEITDLLRENSRLKALLPPQTDPPAAPGPAGEPAKAPTAEAGNAW